MTETFLEKLKKLREDFERRKKQIDTLIENYNTLAVSADKMVKEVNARMVQLEDTVDHVDTLITTVTQEVDGLAKQLEKLKKKKWFRLLFGSID